MVGKDGGAQSIRKMFISLAVNSYTSIEYWEKKKFSELWPWIEAFKEEGAEDNG